MKGRRRISKLIVLGAGVALTLAASVLMAVQTPAPVSNTGPHGGSVLEERGQRFEITVNPESRLVDVYALKLDGQPPQSLSVTLFRGPYNKQELRLRSVEPSDPQIPHYQGQLSVAYDSYMAFGLTMNFSLGPTQVGPLAPGPGAGNAGLGGPANQSTG